MLENPVAVFFAGLCLGWIVTTAAYLLALAFCRSAATADPESPYYREVK